eukprot:2781794-Rhodomonas_salina.1
MGGCEARHARVCERLAREEGVSAEEERRKRNPALHIGRINIAAPFPIRGELLRQRNRYASGIHSTRSTHRTSLAW